MSDFSGDKTPTGNCDVAVIVSSTALEFLERRCAELTRQRDEARKLAEEWRNRYAYERGDMDDGDIWWSELTDTQRRWYAIPWEEK